jgi:enoyl-CoA hydratase/carnithine racemase
MLGAALAAGWFLSMPASALAASSRGSTLNLFEIVVGLLTAGAGIGAWVWLNRRPPSGGSRPGG